MYQHLAPKFYVAPYCLDLNSI